MSTIKCLKVIDEGWDCLIVLDACRYDYFSELYSLFFEGRLVRAVSLGSCTYEWLVKNFTNHYPDVVYVSGNPYVNSYCPIGDFFPRKHFGKIIDVWEYAWNDAYGTVFPQDVNTHAVKALYRFWGRRLIIHYLQPHAPYIIFKKYIIGFSKPDVARGDVLMGITPFWVREPRIVRYYRKVENVAEKFLRKTIDVGYGFTWRVREVLKLPPALPMDAYRRLIGVEGLRRAYKGNLFTVLYEITPLVRDLLDEGLKVVITSDHGECLGEGNAFSHWCGSRRSVLRLVPWFEVRGVKKVAKRPRYEVAKRVAKLVRARSTS